MYAALHPAETERVVVAEAAPRDEVQPARGPSAADRFYGATSFDSFDDALRKARAAGTRATDEELHERLRHNLRTLADGRVAWRYDPRVIAANDRGELRPSPQTEWELVRRIRSPTLIVRGAQSEFARSEAAQARVRRFREIVSTAHVADVEGAGHGLWMDQPGATLAAIRPFLER